MSNSSPAHEAGDAQMGSRILARVAEGCLAETGSLPALESKTEKTRKTLTGIGQRKSME